MAVYYIGSFPPSYGGVTIKNKNLYEALPGSLKVRRIDMNRVKRGDLREILRFFWAMLTGRQFLIGLAGQKNRRLFTRILYRFRRRAMERSVMLVMGGVVEDMIQAGPAYLKMLRRFRRVYVELPGMVRKLKAAGVNNVTLYPNGRPRPHFPEPVRKDQKTLRGVFFSQIEPEKGADRILDAARQLPGIEFHFYGRIVPEYRERFLGEIKGQCNVWYHGVFTGSADAVYRELNRYDVLLLPTRCNTEGLPGILIEAKIAGIAVVLTQIRDCREIVADGTDGVILQEDTAQALEAALRDLDEHREFLMGMKYAGRASAERYYIDVCAADVIRNIQEG